MRRQSDQAIAGGHQRHPVKSIRECLQQVQRNGGADRISDKIDSVQAKMIEKAGDIGREVRCSVRTCVVGLVAPAMAPEVQTNDLKPTGDELLRPSEGGIVRLETDCPAVQENERPAVSTNFKVQTNVSVLEGWQRAPFGRNRVASLHRLS